MDKKIKNAFGQIHAETELIERTKRSLQEKKPITRTKRIYQLVAAAACIMCCIWGGSRFYYQPVMTISVDINPSMELGINRMDHVISVEGYNEDGINLAESLDLKHLNYQDAILKILEEEKIQTLLEKDELLEISVVGEEKEAQQKVQKEIEACVKNQENINCHCVKQSEVQEAHEKGMSYGKYRAYLHLKEHGSDITEDEAKESTMRQMHQKRHGKHHN